MQTSTYESMNLFVKSKERASSLFHKEQMLTAQYDIVDAVLDTICSMEGDTYKEESIQEAIEVHFGKRVMESPEACQSNVEDGTDDK